MQIENMIHVHFASGPNIISKLHYVIFLMSLVSNSIFKNLKDQNIESYFQNLITNFKWYYYFKFILNLSFLLHLFLYMLIFLNQISIIINFLEYLPFFSFLKEISLTVPHFNNLQFNRSSFIFKQKQQICNQFRYLIKNIDPLFYSIK